MTKLAVYEVTLFTTCFDACAGLLVFSHAVWASSADFYGTRIAYFACIATVLFLAAGSTVKKKITISAYEGRKSHSKMFALATMGVFLAMPFISIWIGLVAIQMPSELVRMTCLSLLALSWLGHFCYSRYAARRIQFLSDASYDRLLSR